ncbi:permease-like cell division protein FtsX [Modicisalibacter sp. 'Wilcox']|uniref:permease-like cell division protein FtsX n=1 Tax=Modicisalibacter sp. 'Wilcox' TaxID=2679914 RepID=UPI0013D6113F|nr:permease-like cell division protein FtsX [Modicisalibacter sp. 'Wilcox']
MKKASGSRQSPPRRGARSRRAGIDSRARAWLRHHRAVGLDSARRLLRRPLSSLLTMLAIGIALVLPAGLWLALSGADDIGRRLQDSATLTVYLSPAVSESRSMTIADTLRRHPDVASARLITAAEGAAEFQQALGLEDALAELDDNPLPASVVIAPVDTSPAAVRDLGDQLERVDGVDEVRVDLAWLERLRRLAAFGRRLTLALGGLFGLGALLVVGNTIRLSVESRRREIEVVTLIGATHAFVRRPFLYSGAWYGLGGGVVAWLLLALGGRWLAAPLHELAESYGAHFGMPALGWQGSAMLLLSSTLVGWLGGWIAVHRHLADARPR